MLGTQSIRSRYARSRLGQFWPSLSFLITVVSLGVVYSYLWNEPVWSFLPYLAVSQVFWMLISGSVVEGCRTFMEYESLIRTEYHPRSMFVLVLLTRQITYFLHNAVVLVPLLLIFPRGIGWVTFLSVPGMLLVLLNLYWMVLVTGLICTRFRDFPNVIASVMQIMFFITPVVWEPSRLAGHGLATLLATMNPFACLLAIVRDPFMGVVPSPLQYGISLGMLVFGYLFAVWFFARTNRRLVYWL